MESSCKMSNVAICLKCFRILQLFILVSHHSFPKFNIVSSGTVAMLLRTLFLWLLKGRELSADCLLV